VSRRKTRKTEQKEKKEMKRITKMTSGLAALAFATSLSFAGEMAPADKVVSEKRVKELEQAIEDQGIYVETSQKGIKLSGYVDTSYTYNFNGGGTQNGGHAMNRFNDGFGSPTTGLEDSNDFNLNAVKLTLEKALPEENKLAAGFRIDLLMGEDWTVAGDQSLLVQQAYATFRAPIGNGLDFKVGKMVTLLGLEVDERPANMNFSYGLLYTYGLGQAYDAGVNVAYKFNDQFSAQLRLSNQGGADSGFIDQAEVSKVVSFLTTFTAPGGNATLNFGGSYSGDGGFNRYADHAAYDASVEDGLDNGAVVVFDLNGIWKPKFANDKLTLGFDSAIGFGDSGYQFEEGGDMHDTTSGWWGVELYSKYQFSKLFSLAGRAGYLNDRTGSKLMDTYQLDSGRATSTDIWSFTSTAGFDIWENLLTRVEYRLDFLSADGIEETAFSNNKAVNHTVGVNVAYQF
jgi:hypothetical protein